MENKTFSYAFSYVPDALSSQKQFSAMLSFHCFGLWFNWAQEKKKNQKSDSGVYLLVVVP